MKSPNVITRPEWGAKTAKSSSRMSVPALGVNVHHTVTASTKGMTLAQVKAEVRKIESFHASKRWPAPGYGFLFDFAGRIYEGQGWGRVGAHTAGQNSTRVGFSYLGNTENEQPSKAALESMRKMYAEGQRLGWIMKGKPDFKGHRDAPGASTACPGKHLYAALPSLRKNVVQKVWQIVSVKGKRKQKVRRPKLKGAMKRVRNRLKKGWRVRVRKVKK